MSVVRDDALLVLADGSTFEGEAVGAPPPAGIATGEVVFNTVLSGYQEVITDPSYAGQIITFTYPHIGNYGVTAADNEASRPFCRGVVVRDLARRHSNWRADENLDAFLRRHGVAGIAGGDPGRGGAGPATRRRLPRQRSRRPGHGAVRQRCGRGVARCRGARLRHLPRSSAPRPRPRRRHGEAAVRPPRREPPGAATGHR